MRVRHQPIVSMLVAPPRAMSGMLPHRYPLPG